MTIAVRLRRVVAAAVAAFAVACLLVISPVPALAAPGGEPGANPEAPGQIKKKHNYELPLDQQYQEYDRRGKEVRYDAPEINVGAGGAALAVLVVALLLVHERRLERKREG